MRKVSFCTVAVMVLVGLLGFGSAAEAQNEPLVIDNVMGWWDHLNCGMRINAVNAIDGLDSDHAVLTGDETFSAGTDGDNDSEREWCHAWADLGANQQRAATAGAKQSRTDGGITTAADDRVFDMTGWWDGMSDEGRLIAIGAAGADVPDGTAGNLGNLTGTLAGRASAAFMAIGASPEDMEEEAPAIPLVGLGFLGALLAGRGAYLRRHR